MYQDVFISRAKEQITALKDFLLDIVTHFYTMLPAQFSTFDKQFSEFLNELDIYKKLNEYEPSVDDPLNLSGIETALKKEIKIFVVDFINGHIRNAGNSIYRLLGESLIPDSSILVFSPSHLITKSVLVAAKCNPALSVVVVNTKHNLSRD